MASSSQDDNSKNGDAVQVSVAPETPAVPAPGTPGFGPLFAVSMRSGGGSSPLPVPPEFLSSLTPEQVTKVLQIAEAQIGQQYALATKELEAKEKSAAREHDLKEKGGLRLWVLSLLVLVLVGVVVVWAAVDRNYDFIAQLLVPLAMALAGYLAGRGHEKMKKQ